MDTLFTYPQLIHSLFTIGNLLICIGLWGYALYLRRILRSEFLGKTAVHTVRMDLEETRSDLEALAERFTRFQRKDGMRKLREEKSAQESVQAEAARILAQAQQAPADKSSIPLGNKLHLYKGV